MIEPTFGLSRLLITILINAYHEEEVNGKKNSFKIKTQAYHLLKSPYFPCKKDEKLKKKALELLNNLKKTYVCEFDDSGNIGQMYRAAG